MEDFSEYIIKDYKYWSLQVSMQQNYLGRCVIWCKRENALDLSDASIEEMEEFLKIIRELIEAEKKAFDADWFNYTFLGNDTRHLHCHFLPRYSSDRNFAGTTFTDELWGHNPYRGEKKQLVSEDIVQKVKEKLIEVMNG